MTFSSSDEAVATVDATSGAVTIVGAGETTITATFAGNNQYAAAAASYTLTVTTATGIQAIRAEAAQGHVYDLQGRRVQAVKQGGVYIVNGRKVVVK